MRDELSNTQRLAHARVADGVTLLRIEHDVEREVEDLPSGPERLAEHAHTTAEADLVWERRRELFERSVPIHVLRVVREEQERPQPGLAILVRRRPSKPI